MPIELEDKIPPTLMDRVFQFLLTSVERVAFFLGTLYRMPFDGVNRLLHSCKASPRTVLDVQENDLELEDPGCKKSEIREDDHMEEIPLVGPLMQTEVSRQVSLHIGNDSGPRTRDPFKRGFFGGRNGLPLLANYFTMFGTREREKQLFEGETDDEDDETKEQVESAEEPLNTTTGEVTDRKVPQRIQRRRAAAEEQVLNLSVSVEGHSVVAPIETSLLAGMWKVVKNNFRYYRYGHESKFDAAPATEPVDSGAGPSSAPEFVPTTSRHSDLVDSKKVKKDARYQKRFYKRSNAETGLRTAEDGEVVAPCGSLDAQEPPTTEDQTGDGSGIQIGERQVQADVKSVDDSFARDDRAVQGSVEEESVPLPGKDIMFTEPGICPQFSIDIPSPDQPHETDDNFPWNVQSEKPLDLTSVSTKIVIHESDVSFTAQEPMKTEHTSAASAKQMSGETASALPLQGLAFQISEILLKSPAKLQQPATHDRSSHQTNPIESMTQSEALHTATKSKATCIPTIVITEPVPESLSTIKNRTPKQRYEQVFPREVASPMKRDHQEDSSASHAESECSPEKIPKTEKAEIILEHITPLGMESENSSDDTIEYCMENIDFDTKSESTDIGDHWEGDLQ